MTKKTAAIKKVSVKDLEKAVFGDPKELPKLKKVTLKAKNDLKKTELKIKTLQKSIKQKELMLKKSSVAVIKKKTVSTMKTKKMAKLAVDKMKKELKIVGKTLVDTNKKWTLSMNQEQLFAKRSAAREWAVMSFIKKWEKEFTAKSKPKIKSTILKPNSTKQARLKNRPENTVVPMASRMNANQDQSQQRDVSENRSYASSLSSWDDNLKRN